MGWRTDPDTIDWLKTRAIRSKYEGVREAANAVLAASGQKGPETSA